MNPILNLADVALTRFAHGDEFETLDGPVGPAIGARQLGCTLNVVPPGKRAWPFHCHHVNEELAVILEGHGTLRLGDREWPIRQGDVIAFPAGGAGTAHQILNSSPGELRYLSISTLVPMDVVEYPDSGKYAVRVGSAPGQDPKLRSFDLIARRQPPVDYWDAE
jgi:uncharacterized cupin superfamily protein